MAVEIRKMRGVRYGRGICESMRGLGELHSKPFNVSDERWNQIFGKKEKPNESERTQSEQ